MIRLDRVTDILDHQQKSQQTNISLAQKMNGEWVTYSTQDFTDNVNQLSLGLLELGIKPGDKIAIISMNRPEWNFVDFAVQQIKAVSVPMYPNITVDLYNYIFQDAGVKAVFVEGKDLADKVTEAIADLDPMLGIYTFDKLPDYDHWEKVKELGKDRSLEEIEPLKSTIKPTDLFTLIYTSGTTGKPKGVMLSHENLVSNVSSCVPLLPVDAGGKVLSFLPLCHVFERMVTYVYMTKGVSIYYAESIEAIGENLKEVKPHMFSTVPRLLEKVYDKIMAKGADLTGIKRALFFWAVNVGQQYDINNKQGFFYNLKLKLANKLIFSKWREALGGNIKAIVSGSAPLQPRLSTIFWSANIVIMEGYGLTETSPVISVNEFKPENNRIGTVGALIDGVEVKIAEDGEILVKGPNVMMGYYNNQEKTDEVIKDGWFHTGDIGEFVEERFLKITDRKKEMFKTSGGKYIAPSLLENKFKESLFIEQIMVVGEGQKFPGALIVPNFGHMKSYCNRKKIPYTTDEEMIKNPVLLEKFQTEADKYNESFARYEKIKQFRLLPELWTIEKGELTPTQKCKRS